jgi:hypothetical protein
MRHMAASRMARRGVTLPVTQRLLGHTDPKLTAKVYTHLEVDDPRDAVEVAHEIPRYETSRGPGSTAEVDFWTSRDVRETTKFTTWSRTRGSWSNSSATCSTATSWSTPS